MVDGIVGWTYSDYLQVVRRELSEIKRVEAIEE